MRIFGIGVFGFFIGIACVPKNPKASTSSTLRCGNGQETMNGYLDDDGCPDSLARIRILVTGRDNQPVEGAHILFPGLSQPIQTDQTGKAVLFELLPVPSFSLEIRNPDHSETKSVNVQLNEGANEVDVSTDWVTNSSNLDSRHE